MIDRSNYQVLGNEAGAVKFFFCVRQRFLSSTLACFATRSEVQAGGEGYCDGERYPQLRPAVFVGQALHGAEGERSASNERSVQYLSCRTVLPAVMYLVNCMVSYGLTQRDR